MPPAARACIAALAAGALTAGCAGGRGDTSPGDTRGFGGSDAAQESRGSGPGGGRADLNVFISPSGEPFRSGRDAPYASAAWFARADTNHDGRLSRQEFRADAARAFALYDTDGNGVTDAFEIQHYEQAIAPEILPRIEGLRGGEGMDDTLFKPSRGGRGGSHRGGGGQSQADARRQVAGDRVVEGSGLYGVLAEPEPLTAADTDLAGTVTLAKWMARTERRFVLLAAAGQDYLTLADLPRTQAQLLLERRRAREAAARKGAPPPR